MELHISDEETLHESLQLFINMRDYPHFIASLTRRGILERVYEILDFNTGRSAKVILRQTMCSRDLVLRQCEVATPFTPPPRARLATPRCTIKLLRVLDCVVAARSSTGASSC